VAEHPLQRYNQAMAKANGSAPVESGEFARSFARWAARVRGRLAASRVATGATIGLLVGVGAAAGLWWMGQGELRPYSALLGVLGAWFGGWFAHRRRWSDGSVALYLDKQLASDEAIATAIDLQTRDERTAAHEMVLSHASDALRAKPPKGMWPRMWRVWHAVAPLAVGAIVWLSITQLPPTPVEQPPPPGTQLITLQDVDGLDKVIALSELDPRDEAQRQRLKKLSERAEKLREKLRKGMEKREAQDEIARLRDDVAAERQKLGSGSQRAGLEAAINKMGNNPDLSRAQKALGDRDLTAFDEEMEKLANSLEDADREAAKKALEEAAKAAREKGAEDVAKTLEEQKKLLEERSKRAKALKELAKAFGDGLSPEAKKALEDFERSGSGKDAQKLSDQLGKALENLSEEDRKKLAKKMKEQAGQIDPNGTDAMPMTKEQLEEMQKKLGTPEGQKQLAEQLKEWANQPPQSGESQRQKGLGDAQKGLNDAQKQLGTPMPTPGPQQGQQGQQGKGKGQQGKGKGQQGKGKGQQGQGKGQQGQGKGQQGQGKGQQGQGQGNQNDQGDGQGGPGPGGGQGDHAGSTKPIQGDSVRSRANARLNPGAPNRDTSLGRAPGRAGETANRQGTGRLGEVGASQVGNVERSEVPQEYREQVGRYFQP
jgi:hypothetical protein